MIRTLKELFNTLTGSSDEHSGTSREHALQLATAVLLVEVMRADNDCRPEERESAKASLRTRFGLDAEAVDRLFEEAEAASRSAHDLQGFTSRLNKALAPEEKIRMVDYLWKMAFSDGTLSHIENQLMLKLGDLLYIPRAEFVAAKQRAREAAQ